MGSLSMGLAYCSTSPLRFLSILAKCSGTFLFQWETQQSGGEIGVGGWAPKGSLGSVQNHSFNKAILMGYTELPYTEASSGETIQNPASNLDGHHKKIRSHRQEKVWDIQILPEARKIRTTTVTVCIGFGKECKGLSVFALRQGVSPTISPSFPEASLTDSRRSSDCLTYWQADGRWLGRKRLWGFLGRECGPWSRSWLRQDAKEQKTAVTFSPVLNSRNRD